MSEQFSIPVPNLESNPFDFLPLSLVPPTVGSVVTKRWPNDDSQEINERSFLDNRKVSGTPLHPSAESAPHIPSCYLPLPDL